MLFARINDIVMGVCVCAYPPYPDIGIITTGDVTHTDTGMPVARVKPAQRMLNTKQTLFFLL